MSEWQVVNNKQKKQQKEKQRKEKKQAEAELRKQEEDAEAARLQREKDTFYSQYVAQGMQLISLPRSLSIRTGSAEISNSIFNTFWEIEEKERRKEERLARAAANGHDSEEEEPVDDVRQALVCR